MDRHADEFIDAVAKEILRATIGLGYQTLGIGGDHRNIGYRQNIQRGTDTAPGVADFYGQLGGNGRRGG